MKPTLSLLSAWPHSLLERLHEHVDCYSRNSTKINAAVLAALGPRGVLITNARGAIVDEDALVEALRNRKMLAAGLDVFCNEPHVTPTPTITGRWHHLRVHLQTP